MTDPKLEQGHRVCRRQLEHVEAKLATALEALERAEAKLAETQWLLHGIEANADPAGEVRRRKLTEDENRMRPARGRLSPNQAWARAAAERRRRKWEDTLAQHIKASGLPTPEREYRFHPTRRWLFDFAFVPLRVAAEVEGGLWIGGRHVTGVGYEADAEKYAEAARAGWIVVRFTPRQIKTGYAVRALEDVLRRRPPDAAA